MNSTQKAAPLTIDDLKVIDADTHFTEPYDLWTSRATGRWKDLMPHVVKTDSGDRVWLFNGDDVLSAPAGSGSSIKRDGTKKSFWEYTIESTMPIEEAAVASYEPKARMEMMDKEHIWAQIIYPNVAGFGANRLLKCEDKALSAMIVSIYNDAVAELQAASDHKRLFPQALVPFWDIDAAVRETARAVDELGLKGIAMCSEPHSGGLPDLVDEHWNPLWELCSDRGIPVNFHIGASEFGMDAFLKSVWPSQDRYRKHIVGAVNLELHNARIIANLVSSNLLDRYPDLHWVSVESGIGWIPYVLERLEYQLREPQPEDGKIELTSPLELFHRQVHACFWFEEVGPSRQLDYIGFDNVMFESDFPHPTCLYPSAVEHGLRVLEQWGPEVQRKVMQDNAAKLYGIDVSS